MSNRNSSSVREFYDDKWASGRGGGDQYRRLEADRYALEQLEPLNGMLVLDVGAGAGTHAAALAVSGAKVIAADISHASLQRVGIECPAAFRVRCDADRLPFKRKVFDRAAYFSVVMFLRPARCFSEAGRILKPGGRVVVVEPLSSNPVIRGYRMIRRQYQGLARWLSAAELRKSVREHLRIIRWREFYPLPAAPFLPPGSLRKAVYRVESLFLWVPFARRLAWVAVVLAEKNRAEE